VTLRNTPPASVSVCQSDTPPGCVSVSQTLHLALCDTPQHSAWLCDTLPCSV